MRVSSFAKVGLLGFVALPAALASLFFASTALASHAWGTYHWARTANPFTLKLGDNVSASWDGYLVGASRDWSANPGVLYPGAGIAKVLDTTVVSGSTNPRTCKATSGMVQVCNSKYGNTGWLGVAQIWVSGSHIVAGTVKVNDTYFNTPTYDKPAWRSMVMCQEIGHTLGLDHQDENFYNSNLGTCMDYTNSPARDDGFGTNEHPNLHDYEELAIIYGSHTDSFNSFSSTVSTKPGAAFFAQSGNFEDLPEWGRAIRSDSRGKTSLFERDLGGKGDKVFTFVIWADSDALHRR